ncbi:hypothetical protein lerEdw1_006429 [Lerista edwardsae]|nr:hypothetical protein lerEdw1_006429 [Lerista edwardsae]
MAEKRRCQTLNSSIRSEDILSDMELLPPTAPTTPVQEFPHSHPATPYSSKVTAQLYASLQQSRHAEAQALSHLENQHGLGLARKAKAPEVDLETLAEELSLRLSTGVEASAYRKVRSWVEVPAAVEGAGCSQAQDPAHSFPLLQGGAAESRHISEMENVRCHLQSMLRESRDVADGKHCYQKSENGGGAGGLLIIVPELESARPLQEVSPPASMMGFEELFPRYTSLRLGQIRDHPSYADAHLLRDSLGKEQARRKHCERHIQTLQNRILELQQQLAVAVSADKKKNSMIEQLDKTLAKVVEGWNRHEAERTAALRRLQVEKEAAEQALGRQKEVRRRPDFWAGLQPPAGGHVWRNGSLCRVTAKVAETEGHLQQARAALSREQQAASQLCKEKEALKLATRQGRTIPGLLFLPGTRPTPSLLRPRDLVLLMQRLTRSPPCPPGQEEEKASLSCNLEAERQRVRCLEAEWDLERRQQEALRATLEEQQRSWAQRERQLEQQCQAVQEDGHSQLDKERAAAQREAQKAADAQRALASVQSEVQELEARLEAVCRERDNLKMELGLAKARYDAQKVKLESELKVALEERVTERLAEVHEESLRQMSTMREQHRKQLLELSSHHEKELASQLAQFKADLAEREERQRQLTENYEHRLSRQLEEVRELQAKHRRQEAQRAEMVSQFQAMMQAHWNEVLHLFAVGSASPQASAKALQQQQQQQQAAPTEPDRASEPAFLKPPEPLKKGQRVESLGSSQGGGDCEGAGWTRAVPLHPRTQGSSLQGPAEGPEKPVPHLYRHFLPLLPDGGRLSSEFSHLLNCSLLSQQGFQQLEPQVDHTRMDADLTFHPENLAEHPFTDDTDETATEAVGSEGETPQHSSLESGSQGPQPDLNFCMQLLLNHPSNESCAQKPEGFSTDSLQHPVNRTQFGTLTQLH